MVYPKQEIQVRKAILEGLEDCRSPETGIGYNLLFDRVSNKVGSKATFNKYLEDLKHEGYVTKTGDPRHKGGVVIYRMAGSEFELQRLELMEKLLETLKGRELKTIQLDEKEFGKLEYALKRNVEIVCNAILLSHQTITSMLPKIEANYGSHPYIKISEEKGKIRLDLRRD